jgi:ribosomal-protein-alanine N-acetyltransferase
MTAARTRFARSVSDLTAIDRSSARPGSPWSRSINVELAKASSICLGAYEGDRLVGYVVNSRYVDAWHVMNVAVDPELQRHGIATRLLERLFELTRDDQRRGYTLEVRVSNTEAIALYETLGFARQGIRRAYYTDNREDALIMWRDPEPFS